MLSAAFASVRAPSRLLPLLDLEVAIMNFGTLLLVAGSRGYLSVLHPVTQVHLELNVQSHVYEYFGRKVENGVDFIILK